MNASERRQLQEREKIHLMLLEQARKGLADMNAGRTLSVAEVRARYARPVVGFFKRG